jgi:hypothetical protein
LFAVSCGEDTSPSERDDTQDDEPVTVGKKDAGSTTKPTTGKTDAGTPKDAGSKPTQTTTPDAGKATTPKLDAGKVSTPVDAGKVKDAGKDKDKDAGTSPTTPTGPKPTSSTKIGDIADDWREPTCAEVAGTMRDVVAAGGILDCLGQAIRAAKMANDQAGCQPAREICNESVDPLQVQATCEGTQLLVCEEATVGAVRTCLADMKKSLDTKNQKLSCSSTEDEFLASALPLPASCAGFSESCPALRGLVHFFD